ncbi:MAG: GAF domain-containing protein, partial [Candidatus Omnitrophica bacterium]|nr:GAF domain-containing protein [Candidatus Omnitrophota bacterium]
YGAKEEIKKRLQKMRLEPGQGIVGKVIKTGQSYISLDTQDDRDFYKGIDKEIGFKTKSLICVPLKVKDGIIGALQVINKEGEDEKFNQDDVELLEEIASHAALAIRNAQLYQEVENWREFNEAIIESINEGVFVVDRALKVITGNNGLEELSGGLYTKEYLKGREAREIFPYLNLESVYREVFQSGKVFQQSSTGGRLLNFKFIPRKSKNGEVEEIIVLVNRASE